jgi:hypothetical protein
VPPRPAAKDAPIVGWQGIQLHRRDALQHEEGVVTVREGRQVRLLSLVDAYWKDLRITAHFFPGLHKGPYEGALEYFSGENSGIVSRFLAMGKSVDLVVRETGQF